MNTDGVKLRWSLATLSAGNNVIYSRDVEGFSGKRLNFINVIKGYLQMKISSYNGNRQKRFECLQW